MVIFDEKSEKILVNNMLKNLKNYKPPDDFKNPVCEFIN
jgi:hypothetical protein